MATANANEWDLPKSLAASTGQSDSAIVSVLKVLGSLKLTVALFAFSLVLVYAGTVAQQDRNMVEVKQQYFTAWVSMMRVDDLLPQAFIPHPPLPDFVVLPFPGGATIGLLLMINLLAAKITRFHVRATKGRLALGAAIFGFGLFLCWAVVQLGNSDGVQGEPPISYKTLWSALVAGLVVLWLAAVFEAFQSTRLGWRIVWGAVAIVSGFMGLAALVGWFEMSSSSLRITWQLIEGTIVATVLLVGSRIMFGAQGANLLLHFGVALMMIGQFAFGDTQLEQRLSLVEGQSTNTLVNLDHVELAFIEDLGEGKQRVTAIPEVKLKSALRAGVPLSDERLPVDIRVLSFFDNSDVMAVDQAGVDAKEPNPATAGNGLAIAAKELPKAGGTSEEMDLAAAYVELLPRGGGDSLGVYLVSQIINERKFLSMGDKEDLLDDVKVGDNKYAMQLRFTRVPKPYWVQVKDVRRINYSGTNTPRDYSSFIKLVNTESGDVQNARVWMNNPLRYGGETFYQSDYRQLPGGKEFTSIQVVRNAGWMIPYIACMIVGIGMIAHFSSTLDRFMGRREREVNKSSAKMAEIERQAATSKRWRGVWVLPVAIGGLLFLGLIPWSSVMMTMSSDAPQQKFDMYELGQVPVRFGGRVMPLDAYARTALRAVSNKTSLPLKPVDKNSVVPAPSEIVDRADKAKRLSALQWLLEAAAGKPELRELHMFRIDADEVLAHFNLKRRAGNLYSLEELIPELATFDATVRAAADKAAGERSFKENKFLELAERIDAFEKLSAAFGEPRLPDLPPQFDSPDLSAQERQRMQFMLLEEQMGRLDSASVAAIVPPTTEFTTESMDTPPWRPWASASFDSLVQTFRGEEGIAGVASFKEIVESYSEQDPARFNQAVQTHLNVVREAKPRDYDVSSVSLERWMEAVHPAVLSAVCYGVLLVLGIIAIAMNSHRLRLSVWASLVCVLIVHAVVILSRIYITGKAPVINLYSSAVFVGFATAFIGLVFERVFPRGIGNALTASTGMLSLIIAWGLADGDTMPVLQAVLDTQFWLSTHVITVTLGYAATFVAGGLGIIYILGSLIDGPERNESKRDLYRMIYSAVCFGILFSFVGTVLGGLWADDSWGRFWGWDPKENGALLIVIWNALALHARWDGMVKERGLAVLAVIGNIVTAWSWFGTNQLGIGLHSYGFTTGAVVALTIFFVSQLVFIALGLFALKRPEPSK